MLLSRFDRVQCFSGSPFSLPLSRCGWWQYDRFAHENIQFIWSMIFMVQQFRSRITQMNFRENSSIDFLVRWNIFGRRLCRIRQMRTTTAHENETKRTRNFFLCVCQCIGDRSIPHNSRMNVVGFVANRIAKEVNLLMKIKNKFE